MEPFAWKPHPGMQTEFCSRGEDEILGGGAAGPGKTDCLIAMALRNVWHPKYHGLILRRTTPRLDEIIDRTKDLYSAAVPGAVWNANKNRWTFPSGARVTLGHCQHEEDKRNYQGKEYHFIGFDELTEFTETQYKFIAFSRRRRTQDMPFPTIVRCTSNPGGIGHKWVKERFQIGTTEPGTTIYHETVLPDGEIVVTTRAFIPGKLADNPSIVQSEYIASLMHLPDGDRRRLLEGLWDVFEGQAFRELNRDVHGFDFDPPADWPVYGSFDWGYAKPWSFGLWAVDYDGRMYRFDEIYGAKEGELDEGRRQTDGEIAREILALLDKRGVKPKQIVADPACWSVKPTKGGVQGPSVASNFRDEGLHIVKAHNDRVGGRQQLHHRLKPDEDGRPWIYFHTKRCKSVWETLPLLKEDENNPEDIETKNVPDHVADEIRYQCMTRPMRPRVQPRKDTGSFQAARRQMIRAKQHAERHGISIAAAYSRVG